MDTTFGEIDIKCFQTRDESDTFILRGVVHFKSQIQGK